MILGPQILDKLTAQAKDSTRLRMDLGMCNSPAIRSQRIFDGV